MSAPTITSYETIKAGFPPITFKADENNPPNLTFLLLRAEHLGECAQTHAHREHSTGHTYPALTATMWALKNANAYPARQQHPRVAMIHPDGYYLILY